MLESEELVKQRFEKSAQSYDTHAVVQQQAVMLLLDKINALQPNYSRILESGAGTGYATKSLCNFKGIEQFYVNDLVSSYAPSYKAMNPNLGIVPLMGNMEELDFPSDLNIILGANCLQWVSDLPAFLAKCANALQENGIIAFTTFGPQNFMEIKKTTGVSLNYIEAKNLTKHFSEHFKVLDVSETDQKLYFKNPCHVLKHMKDTGVNGVSQQKWTKGKHQQFIADYEAQFTCEHGVPLTYHPITIIARKK